MNHIGSANAIFRIEIDEDYKLIEGELVVSIDISVQEVGFDLLPISF